MSVFCIWVFLPQIFIRFVFHGWKQALPWALKTNKWNPVFVWKENVWQKRWREVEYRSMSRETQGGRELRKEWDSLWLGKMGVGHICTTVRERSVSPRSAEDFECDCCLLYGFHSLQALGKRVPWENGTHGLGNQASQWWRTEGPHPNPWSLELLPVPLLFKELYAILNSEILR